MNRWENKVAIVTGASAGIGEAICEQLVNAGIKVVGLARRKEKLDELAARLMNRKANFYSRVCDVSNESDVLKEFTWIKDNLGPIYILINNAGYRRNTNLIEGDTKLWKEIFDTNVLGLCVCTREAVKNMRANNVDGHIVHINSVAGHKVHYVPEASVYPASKFAVTALTETLRLELNSIKSKIKITSVSPGVVATEFRKAAGVLNTKEKLEREASMPHLEAIDVANAVLYALSTPPHVQIHELIIKPMGEVA